MSSTSRPSERPTLLDRGDRGDLPATPTEDHGRRTRGADRSSRDETPSASGVRDDQTQPESIGDSARAMLLHAPSKTVPRPSATYRLRRRGLSPKRQAEFEAWIERWGLDPLGPMLDWNEVFPAARSTDATHSTDTTHSTGAAASTTSARSVVSSPSTSHADTSSSPPSGGRPAVVLDIGFGHGESTIAMARTEPHLCVVAVDVHTPGAVTVLDAVENDPLPHVRVVYGDALVLLDRIPADSLAGVRVYFPDPWKKARQHHRRLVRADTVDALTTRLRVGGFLHLATDIADYADQMEDVGAAEPRLAGGRIERPAWRPLTRFEQRGLDAGRQPVDLWYERIEPERIDPERPGSNAA